MYTPTTPQRATSTPQPTRDQIIMMGAGAVALLASFMPWVSVSLGFVSGSGNAWQSGLPAWSSVLVAMAVAAAVAANAFLGIKLPTVGRFTASNLLIAGAVLGLALMVVRAIWLPSLAGVSIGLSFGFFIAIVASVAQVISAIRCRAAQQAAR
jgi:hypothetical protein